MMNERRAGWVALTCTFLVCIPAKYNQKGLGAVGLKKGREHKSEN